MSIKSIRLSEAKRNDILQSALAAWEELNPEPPIKELENAVSNYYYDKAYAGEMRKMLDLPKIQPFLRKGRFFLVQIEGAMVKFRFENEIPLPHCCHSYPCIYITDKKPKIHKDWDSAVIAHEKWRENRTTMKQEISSILATCSTTGQLLELWPEIEPLIPAYLSDPSKGINLPSIPVSRLNERLNLIEKTND